MKIKIIFQIIVLLIGGFTTNLYAYKTATHQDITAASAALSGRYQQFITEFTIDPSVSKGLMVFGSFAEDEPYRYLNHFYDPINETGLNFLGFLQRVPAPTWGNNDASNAYSWAKARDYMYEAFTGTDQEARDTNFRKLFRSLGQVVHLLQDMAQPSHVRNDPHASHSEDSTGIFPAVFNPSHLEDWAQSHESDVIAFSNNAIGPTSVVSFDDVFETLSLLSNENFFSDDTIFKNYALPAIQETNYYDALIQYASLGELFQIFAEDGQIYQVPYIVKKQGALAGYKLAQVGYFGNVLLDKLVGQLITFGEIPIHIDDEVAKENAQKLIPLATGFSAKLLDYFFRGQLEITLAQGGLKVKNTSTESMIESGINIYYDDTTLTRHFLAAYGFDSLSPGEETPLIPFTRPSNNIKGRYIVVFNGQLGAEEGVVIGAMSPPPLYYVSKRSGVYKIFRMDGDGSNQEVVYDNTNPNLTISKLAISPDGKTLAFTVEGPRIYLLDLTSHALSELTQGDWPDWSPDGKKIVFERDVTPDYAYLQGIKRWSNTEIFVRTIASGSEVQLTEIPPIEENSGTFKGHPAFSPDGRTIAYTRWPADKADCDNPTSFMIYLMDASGNSNRPLTCDKEKAWLDEAPSWSPDGHEIAFLRRWVNEYDQLYKVSVDTKGITKLTESDGTAYAEFTPAWSSDGKAIAIGSNRDGDFDIWRVNPSGSGYLNNLTADNPEMDGFPAYVK